MVATETSAVENAAVGDESQPVVREESPESNPEEDWRSGPDVRDFDPSEGSEDEPAPPTVDEDAPSLDTLTAAIPETNRELLEELFRGRFVRVKKFDPNELR